MGPSATPRRVHREISSYGREAFSIEYCPIFIKELLIDHLGTLIPDFHDFHILMYLLCTYPPMYLYISDVGRVESVVICFCCVICPNGIPSGCAILFLDSSFSHIKPEKKHVAVLHHVITAFLPE